jgi:hypothetical protein
MKRILIVAVAILALAATAFVGYCAGWFEGVWPGLVRAGWVHGTECILTRGGLSVPPSRENGGCVQSVPYRLCRVLGRCLSLAWFVQWGESWMEALGILGLGVYGSWTNSLSCADWVLQQAQAPPS